MGALLLVSCGASRVVTTKGNVKKQPKVVVVQTPKVTQPKQEVVVPKDKISAYIQQYKTIAQTEMQAHGVPASITLAQGILESGSGYGSLSKRANNHFGIKCHGWKGEKVYHDDDAKGECFRKYADPSESFKDHSLFLSTRSRYAFLFKLKPTNYKAWAKGLKKAGYATDSKYPAKLISLIERYKLYEYDVPVHKKEDVKKTQITYTVKKGDTLYAIAKKYNVEVSAIIKDNNLSSQNLHIEQQLIVKY